MLYHSDMPKMRKKLVSFPDKQLHFLKYVSRELGISSSEYIRSIVRDHQKANYVKYKSRWLNIHDEETLKNAGKN